MQRPKQDEDDDAYEEDDHHKRVEDGEPVDLGTRSLARPHLERDAVSA